MLILGGRFVFDLHLKENTSKKETKTLTSSLEITFDV
jgi:hypothetical protein